MELICASDSIGFVGIDFPNSTEPVMVDYCYSYDESKGPGNPEGVCVGRRSSVASSGPNCTYASCPSQPPSHQFNTALSGCGVEAATAFCHMLGYDELTEFKNASRTLSKPTVYLHEVCMYTASQASQAPLDIIPFPHMIRRGAHILRTDAHHCSLHTSSQ